MLRRRPIALLVLVGLVLRIVMVLATAKHPADPRFVADPYAYLLMADHAYHGRYFVSFRGLPTSYLSVGYPFIIAVARHLVLGLLSSWVVAILLNMCAFVAIACAMPRLIAAMGLDADGSHDGASRVAVVAAAVLAVYPDFVFGTGLVMSELVGCAFLVWGMVLVAEACSSASGRRTWVLAGALCGLAVFTRPSFMVAVVVVPLVVAVGRHWRAGVVVLFACLLPLVPLAANNMRVGGGPGITSATWPNICDGALDPSGRFEWRRECRVTMLPGEQHTAATESRNTEWARKVAVWDISRDPLAWVSRAPVRLMRSVWSGGWATEFSVRWAQNYVWTTKLRVFLWVSRVFFLAVCMAALRETVRRVRTGTFQWLVPVLVTTVSLSGVPITFGQSRFGWPLAVVVLVPLCAAMLVRAGQRVRPLVDTSPR